MWSAFQECSLCPKLPHGSQSQREPCATRSGRAAFAPAALVGAFESSMKTWPRGCGQTSRLRTLERRRDCRSRSRGRNGWLRAACHPTKRMLADCELTRQCESAQVRCASGQGFCAGEVARDRCRQDGPMPLCRALAILNRTQHFRIVCGVIINICDTQHITTRATTSPACLPAPRRRHRRSSRANGGLAIAD